MPGFENCLPMLWLLGLSFLVTRAHDSIYSAGKNLLNYIWEPEENAYPKSEQFICAPQSLVSFLNFQMEDCSRS